MAGRRASKRVYGPPVGIHDVEAIVATTSFQAKKCSVVPAGIIQINYIDQGGTHTLVFQESQFSGFQLAVPQGPKTGKVDLKPGSYTIYCTIPGHRQGGMQATVNIGPAP